MFEFLEENWSKLSPAVMKALKDRPLVPVGARLIKAGRLFFRLKVGVVSSLSLSRVPPGLGLGWCVSASYGLASARHVCIACRNGDFWYG